MLCRHRSILISFIFPKNFKKCYHGVPFLNFYQKVTGEKISEDKRSVLKKRHPNIEKITKRQIENVLQILSKFGITADDACKDPHVFSMNIISMDNYGEILKECGFSYIIPKHIIRYHTIVKTRTIENLKKEGLLKCDLNLEETVQNSFTDWPDNQKVLKNFPESSTSILTVRTSVLESYLKWRLSITEDEFQSFCRNYLPLRHRPMCDINEAINIAQTEIKFDMESIRRNGFIISSDPLNTKLIIENVNTLAGFDIRDAIRNEPAILKNNYNSLLEIRQILEDYGINEEAQRRCLRVYCMRPQTVKERLDELKKLPEFQILSTNPRVLSMVVHKRKVMSRLEKIHTEKKQSYSLNSLISSKKIFNHYITSFGNKVCGRDIVVLLTSSFELGENKENGKITSETEERRNNLMKAVLEQLKRHKYWLHSSLYIVNENIQYLKRNFYGNVIINNCQIVLYPLSETERYFEFFLRKRRCGHEKNNEDIDLEGSYNNLNYGNLTDDQILSLVLYEIEKKYHFSGDGIWCRHDGAKAEIKC